MLEEMIVIGIVIAVGMTGYFTLLKLSEAFIRQLNGKGYVAQMTSVNDASSSLPPAYAIAPQTPRFLQQVLNILFSLGLDSYNEHPNWTKFEKYREGLLKDQGLKPGMEEYHEQSIVIFNEYFGFNS